jgi:hypothetical protein
MTIAPEINGDTDPDTDDEMPDLTDCDTDSDADDQMPDLSHIIFLEAPWNTDGVNDEIDLPDLVDNNLTDQCDTDSDFEVPMSKCHSEISDLPDLVDIDLPDLVDIDLADSDLPDLVDIDLAGLQILSGNHRLYSLAKYRLASSWVYRS